MIATLINAAVIIICTLIGIFFKNRKSKKYESIIFAAAGIITISIGVNMVSEVTEMLIFALSLILGGIVGTFLGIEDNIEKIGESLKKRFSPNDNSSNFVTGFISCSMLFCVGAMAIVGSFEAGTQGKYDIIFTKTVIDGFVTIMMASIYGIGVGFSAFSVLIYQGLLTIGSSWLQVYVTDLMLSEITAVGGAMLIMVGLNLLKVVKIKTIDFIPALFFVIFFILVLPYFSIL